MAIFDILWGFDEIWRAIRESTLQLAFKFIFYKILIEMINMYIYIKMNKILHTNINFLLKIHKFVYKLQACVI